VAVNGTDTHAVFRWLRLRCGDVSAIAWNFNMFLVGADGTSCTRYSNTRTPSSITSDLEAALEQPTAPPSAGAA